MSTNFDTVNLLPFNYQDQNFGCNESIILLCQFLNQLLVLVHLFQIIDAHDIHTELFRPIDIVGISKHTDGHLRTGDGGKFDLTGETLVTAQVRTAIEINLMMSTVGDHSSSSQFAIRWFR